MKLKPKTQRNKLLIDTNSSTLALGLGNLVHSDDGLGVHAIERLREDPRVPPDAVLMDGGTQGLSLLPHISAYQRLLVIDALDVGEAPGTIVRLEGNALRHLPGKASVHQLGFADLLVALELLGELPEEIVLLGVQPLSTDWSAELTAPVEAALTPLLDAAIDHLAAWSARPLAHAISG
jgi:hydrogenase maturation protease